MTSLELPYAFLNSDNTKGAHYHAWVLTRSHKTNNQPDSKQLRFPTGGTNSLITNERWSRNQSRLTQRKADHLEYTTIAIGSEDKKHIKLHGWAAKEHVLPTFDGYRRQLEESIRKITYPALSVDTERKELTCSPFYNRACSGRCSRAFGENDRDMLAKEFCTILGPEICSECLRTRKKTLEDAKLVFSHSDVSVSPCCLCVPLRTKSAINKCKTIHYGQCNVKYRRFGLVRSYDTGNDAGVMKDRLDSCNSNCTDTFNTLPPDQGLIVALSSFGSRGQCRSRFIKQDVEKKDIGKKQIKEHFGNSKKKNNTQEEEEDAEMPPTIKAVTIRTLPEGTKRRQYSIAATSKQIWSSRKIERTGKLKENSYGEILIPQPPQIGLERMNVSIYTPKSIPGIKIFDESLFEI